MRPAGKTNPWLRDERGGVMVWAHRGGGHEAPSSTLYAMRRSGANGLELDLQPTADLASGSDDGVIVFHDDIVDNVTEATGRVSDRRFADLVRLDPAHWWTPGTIYDHDASVYPLRGRAADDPDLRIPRLVDVLREFPETPINIDLKRPGMEEKVAELLRRFGRTDDVILASFRQRRVNRIRRRLPQSPSTPGFIGAFLLMAGSRAGLALNPWNHTHAEPPVTWWRMRLDRRLVDAGHRAGMAVYVWTVNDLDVLDEVLEMGVDGVVTDVPSLLIPRVAEFNRR